MIMSSESLQLFTVAGFAKKKPYLAFPVSRQLPPPLSSFYFGRGICEIACPTYILPTEYIRSDRRSSPQGCWWTP